MVLIIDIIRADTRTTYAATTRLSTRTTNMKEPAVYKQPTVNPSSHVVESIIKASGCSRDMSTQQYRAALAPPWPVNGHA